MKLYLDHASTTQILPEVVKSMHESYHQFYGNPSSVHRAGYEASKRIESARDKILSMINARNYHLVFTSGGTEANNLAILGMAKPYQKQTLQFMCSEIEHPSVIGVYDHLKHEGVKVSYVPVTKNGILDLEVLHKLLKEPTHIVSMMHVNNETGIIQPIDEAVKLIKEVSPKTLTHVDGVQAFGKIDINLLETNPDLYSISAHKIGGPRGVGALLIKKGVNISPVMWGGGQEDHIRPGTENTSGIIGLEKAACLKEKGISANLIKLWEIRNTLTQQITARIQGITIVENTENAYQFPGILTICVDGVKSEVVLRMLSDDGIYLSAGSACSSRKTSASHVLKAMKLSNTAMDGALRISFNETMSLDLITFFVQQLEKHVNLMRKMMKR